MTCSDTITGSQASAPGVSRRQIREIRRFLGGHKGGKKPGRQLRLLTSGMLGALLLATTLAAAEAPPADPLPRICLSRDGTQLVLSGSDKKFVPWGFNYLGRFGQLAEDDWNTDAGWRNIETDFREMKKLGANVVRWHLQLETFVEAPDRVDAAQLARLKALLKLARKHGLYLDLTGLNCFRLKRIPDWFDALPEAERWAVQARFWSAVAETCAGDSVVFCYDLMNEPIIGEPRKEDEHPWVGGELGGFHFVQRICNQPAGRDSKDIAKAWVKRQVEAIRQHDKETLTTVGVIPWAFVWPNAKPLFYSPQVIRHLDIVSIHVYPTPGKLEKELAALAVYDLGKPLVIEEIFPLNCSIDDLDKFIDAASGRADGWISHYFGPTTNEHGELDEPKGALVAKFLEYWLKKGRQMREDRIDQ
jgi:hypothetical protein